MMEPTCLIKLYLKVYVFAKHVGFRCIFKRLKDVAMKNIFVLFCLFLIIVFIHQLKNRIKLIYRTDGAFRQPGMVT